MPPVQAHQPTSPPSPRPSPLPSYPLPPTPVPPPTHTPSQAAGVGPVAELAAGVKTLQAALADIHHEGDAKKKAEKARVLRLETMIAIREVRRALLCRPSPHSLPHPSRIVRQVRRALFFILFCFLFTLLPHPPPFPAALYSSNCFVTTFHPHPAFLNSQ